MIDGIYQSVMSFFIPYLFVITTFTASTQGLDISDRLHLGMYIAHPAILTINLYIMINTYRWDWLFLLVVVISDLFIFFWTGVYTQFTYSGPLYKAAPECYSQLTFWMAFIITPAICIFPRFAIKCVQKTFWPYDVDIIREQEKQGKFKHLDAASPVMGVQETLPGSSDSSARRSKHAQYATGSIDEDRRPIYPPSVATHNTRTQNGSDGTNYTMHNRNSVEMPVHNEGIEGIEDMPVRPSIERARPSYDRVRASVDRVRASYEASNDFTSAARLSRIESSHSAQNHPNGQRRFGLTTVRRRGMSAFSKKSVDQ
jgi:phospholipid-translocating ATPase